MNFFNNLKTLNNSYIKICSEFKVLFETHWNQNVQMYFTLSVQMHYFKRTSEFTDQSFRLE